jgi:hypothetical protein
MSNQTQPPKPADAEQPADEGLSSSALFGLAVTLERTVNDGWKTTVTTRQLLGYRYADSADAAVGSFLRKALADNEGFTAGQVLVIPIPLPNTLGQTAETE